MSDFDSVKKVIDSKYVKDQQIQKILDDTPQIGSIISTEAFYELCREIFDNANNQNDMIINKQDFRRRGMLKNAVARTYADEVVALTPANQTYKDWFGLKNIDVSNYTVDDFKALNENIIGEATGSALYGKISVSEIQNSMLKILTQLSSYSIQLVGEVIGSNTLLYEIPKVRLSDIRGSGYGHGWMYTFDTRIIRTDFSGRHNLGIFNLAVKLNKLLISGHSKRRIDIGTTRVAFKDHPVIPVFKIVLQPPKSKIITQNESGDVNGDVPGLSEWNNLPKWKKQQSMTYPTGDWIVGPPSDYVDPDYADKGYVDGPPETL